MTSADSKNLPRRRRRRTVAKAAAVRGASSGPRLALRPVVVAGGAWPGGPAQSCCELNRDEVVLILDLVVIDWFCFLLVSWLCDGEMCRKLTDVASISCCAPRRSSSVKDLLGGSESMKRQSQIHPLPSTDWPCWSLKLNLAEVLSNSIALSIEVVKGYIFCLDNLRGSKRIGL